MPEAVLVLSACTECEHDLDHCHGTAFVHVGGSGDCSDDPDCRLAAELHAFSVFCSEVDCTCRLPDALAAPLSRDALSA